MTCGATMRTLVMCLALAAAGVAPADELGDAMARADALSFFTRIGLQTSQAEFMSTPLERVQSIVTRHEADQEQRLQATAGILSRARTLLAGGEQLPPDVQAALDGYREQSRSAQLGLYRGVDQEMRVIADYFTAEQNAMLSWQAPEAVRTEDLLQERLRMQQIAMGRIQEAERMLERVKHLDVFNFVTGRSPIINDYVAIYFPPDTADFDLAHRVCLDHTDRVRMLSEDDWRDNSWDIAGDLVERLGLMPSLDPGAESGKIAWGALYRLFTNPQTLQVVKDLAQAQ